MPAPTPAGYYSRYAALRDLLLRFLAALAAPPSAPPGGQPQRARQVLSLGAGFDTAFFQLAKEGLAQERYIELDFKEVGCLAAAVVVFVCDVLPLAVSFLPSGQLTPGLQQAFVASKQAAAALLSPPLLPPI